MTTVKGADLQDSQTDDLPPTGMFQVTEVEFFAFLRADNRDIMPTTEHPQYSVWRDSHYNVVGRTFPGWRNPGSDRKYFLIRR